MKTFITFQKARRAAQEFFKENFNHISGVAIESANGKQIEFYSLDDPVMIDTFTCMVDDGCNYSCKNGGEVNICDY